MAFSSSDVLLGIDIGTGSIKIALWDKNGTILCIEKKSHAIETPMPGWAEIPLETVWEHAIRTVNEISKNAPQAVRRVKGIGISCLCPGLTPISEEGMALAPSLIYMDTRSLEELKEIRSRIDEKRLFTISGNILMPGTMSLTSMLWFRNKNPSLHKCAAVYGHVNTFIGKKLTGNFGIDPSNASYTGLFETRDRKGWSKEIIQLVGIEGNKLPPIIPSWKPVGYLQNKDFISAGVPEGIPVAMGGADTACSALATGIVDNLQVFESSGTSNVITLCMDSPSFDPRFMNRCHVIPERWLSHGAMSFTGASVKWFRDEILGIENDEQFTYIASLVDNTNPEEPCPVFLPYMAGERSPVWDPFARGILFGLSLTTRKEQIVRAMFEAFAFGSRQLFEIIEENFHQRIESFISVGGWAAINPLNQIKADITHKTIHAVEHTETAAIGAAILGGIAAGVYRDFSHALELIPRPIRKSYKPNSQKFKKYEHRYEIYKSLYPRLKDLFPLIV